LQSERAGAGTAGIARHRREVTMSHLKSTLASLSTAAAILGAAACSSNYPTAANSPSGARPASTYSAYGPAMGEGAGYTAGPSTEATPGEVGKMPPPRPTPVALVPAVPPDEPPIITRSTPSAQGTTAPVTWGGTSDSSEVGVTNPMPGTTDIATLGDAQFAAIVQAMNAGEIQEAQLAMTKATSPEVKRFARDMATAHREMQSKMTALLGRLQKTPSDNAVSNQLRSDAQGETSTLQTLHGKDFDRDYIDASVRNHNKALEMIDEMMPSVKNSEFKAALVNTRPKIEAHLRDAERVQMMLEKGTTSAQPGTSATPAHD
jgi:putative membrane protein